MKFPLSSNLRAAKKVASLPATRTFASEIQRNMPAGTPSESAKAQKAADANAPSFDSIGIKNSSINQKSGVSLSDQQKLIVGSVLDLFEGNPTLKHLSLWAKDATFQDPITTAIGFDKFAAQWYGLPALFNPITIKSHAVTSSGNPIELELSNSYTLKGLGSEQTMNSIVRIDTGPDGKIIKVEDRWNNKIPEGALAQVRGAFRDSYWAGAAALAGSLGQAGFSVFCTVAPWWPFEGLRKLNAVTVPLVVKVPKNEEEDAQMKAEREKN